MRPRTFFLTLLLLISAQHGEGAFLKNVPVTVVQPNGDTLHIYASGDELHNWLHDFDQYMIMQDSTSGYYTYALRVGNWIGASEYRVGASDPRQLGLERGMNLPSEPGSVQSRPLLSAVSVLSATPSKGSIHNIVVFIRFSGEVEFTTPLASYDTLFNSEAAGASTVRNYFLEVSYNQLSVSGSFFPVSSGTTVLSYQDAQPRGYYQPYNAVTNPIGYNDLGAGTRSGERERELLTGAISYITPQVPQGLNIDTDNDDVIDHITFIIRGEPTAWGNILWPHASQMGPADLWINGKKAYNYILVMETRGDVGVFCHEMFHSLGGPDLYTMDGTYPVGAWDIMGYTLRQHMGAYLKWRHGKWIEEIPEITQTGTYYLSPVSTSKNCAYRIASPYVTDQFFLVEYRRKVGPFEHFLPGEGLLVYRIYPERSNGVYIYRPDGTLTQDGNVGLAALSAESGRTGIGPTTNPTPFLLDGSDGGLIISDVSSVGNQMSMRVTVLTEFIKLSIFPLPDFGEVPVGGYSTVQSYSVAGNNLSSDILVTAPPGFEISSSELDPFGSSMSLSADGGTVYVRFHPTLVQPYSGSITHESTGVPIRTLALSGTGVPNAGPLTVNVRNRSNSWLTGSTGYVRLFNSNGDRVDSASIDTSTGFVTLTGLKAPGDMYFCRVWCTPAAGPLFGEEFWGRMNGITLVPSPEVVNVTFTPNSPYITQVRAYDLSTGQEVTGDTVRLGDTVSVRVTITNPSPEFSHMLYSRLLVDENKLPPYALDSTILAGLPLPPGTTKTHEFRFWPTASGPHFAVAGSLIYFEGTPTVSDGQVWTDSPLFTVRVTVSSADRMFEMPQEYSLAQNYPNPFNPQTKIRFGLPHRSHVVIAIFNALGQEVGRLADDEREAGYHEVEFDGSGFASGVYFCRLKAGDFTETKRMMILR